MSYNKISNWVGRNDNFLAKARKLPILPTSLDIYLIYDKTIYVFCIPSIEFFFLTVHRKSYTARQTAKT